MFIDSSVFCAILLEEAEQDEFLLKIREASYASTSPVTILESIMVLSNRLKVKPLEMEERLMQLIEELKIQIIPVDQLAGKHAIEGFALYGKGQSKGVLNFGDCLSYGVAKSRFHPLLYKGDDFKDVYILAA